MFAIFFNDHSGKTWVLVLRKENRAYKRPVHTDFNRIFTKPRYIQSILSMIINYAFWRWSDVVQKISRKRHYSLISVRVWSNHHRLQVIIKYFETRPFGSNFVFNVAFSIIINICTLCVFSATDDRCFENGDSCVSAEWCPQFITEHVHSMTICGVVSMKSMYPVAWKPKYFLLYAVLHMCSLDLALGKSILCIITFRHSCIHFAKVALQFMKIILTRVRKSTKP